MNDEHYANLKPTHGEDRYIEYDDEFDCWAIFGSDSGFCYGQYNDEQTALANL